MKAEMNHSHSLAIPVLATVDWSSIILGSIAVAVGGVFAYVAKIRSAFKVFDAVRQAELAKEEQAKKERHDLRNDITAEQLQLVNAQAQRIDGLLAQVSEFKGSSVTFQHQYDEMVRKYDALQRENAMLQGEIKELRRERDRMQDEIKDLRRRVAHKANKPDGEAGDGD